MATAGAGFTFPLPAQVSDQGAVNAVVQIESQMPSWLSYNNETRMFIATAVPDGAFPTQVVVVVGGVRSTITISARNE